MTHRMTLGTRAAAVALGAALALVAPTAAWAGSGLVVHEWGTFTSFAGSDGLLLEFSTDAGGDLPAFVYTRAKLEAGYIREKKSTASLQRMETPVTYFYAKEPLDVEVEVRFPKGVLTEFYPHVRAHEPSASDTALEGGFLRWGKVRVIPAGHAEARGVLLPQLAKGDDPALAEHYLYARETDSALVRVCQADGPFATEHEKFLFYRGIGNFALPLAAQALRGGAVVLRNAPVGGMAYPIGRSFVLEVSDDLGRARLAEVDGVSPGEARQVALPAEHRPSAEVLEELSARLVDALVRAGLYEKEAQAMVKTWRSSYFTAPGLRVLYVVPQALTDALLPLSVSPAPDRVVRVLLGRAEVLTPEREAAIEAHVRALGSERYEAREAATEALRHLGRYAAPALERVARQTKDPEVRSRAEALLESLRPRPAPAAARG